MQALCLVSGQAKVSCAGEATVKSIAVLQEQQQAITGQPCSLMQAARLMSDNKNIRWGAAGCQTQRSKDYVNSAYSLAIPGPCQPEPCFACMLCTHSCVRP